MQGPYATSWRELERAAPIGERARNAARRAALVVLRRRVAQRPPGLRIVYYHYVFDDQVVGFANQIAYLAAEFETVTLTEGVTRLREGRLTGRELAVTFDDGFRNLLTNAAPVLAAHGVKACFYITTGLIEAPPERVLEICRDQLYMPLPAEPLSWDDVRELRAQGHEIGSHTVSHPNLAALSPLRLDEELRESRAELARRLGEPPVHFGAPYGNRGRFSPAVSAAARVAGYASCASAERGVNATGADLFALRRDHLLPSWPRDDVRYFLSRA